MIAIFVRIWSINAQTVVWKFREARYLHFLHHFLLIKNNILTICEGYMAFQKGTTRGINPASGTANTRPCNETIGFEQCCHLWNLFLAVWQHTQWYICTELAVGTVRFVFKGVRQIRNKLKYNILFLLIFL